MNFNGAAGDDWFSVQEIDAGLPDAYFINSWGSQAKSSDDLVFPAQSANLGGYNVTLGAGVTLSDLSGSGSLSGEPNASITLQDASAASISGESLGNVGLVGDAPTVTLTGGTIEYDAFYPDNIASGVTGMTWINHDTLEGSASISSDGQTGGPYDTFINYGTITANTSGGGAISGFGTGDWRIVNTGAFSATAGNQFAFNDNPSDLASVISLDNVGGVISASGPKAYVTFLTTTISGGTIESSDGGLLIFDSSDTLDGTSSPITIDGEIQDGDANGIHPGVALTLKGTIDFSAASVIDFVGSSELVFDGEGFDFVAGMWVDASLEGGTGADSLTNAGVISGHDTTVLIEGLTLTNTGTIDATGLGVGNSDVGFNVKIGGDDALGAGTTTVVNDNLMEATDGGVLDITDGYNGTQALSTTVDDSGGGEWLAADGSTAELSGGARLIGGDVRTQGSGVFVIGDGILDGTNSGGLTLDAGAKVTGTNAIDLVGEIVNNGAITTPDVAVAAGASARIDGTGVISPFSFSGGGSLTLGQGQTVNDDIGFAGDGGTLINYGAIENNASSAGWIPGNAPAAFDNFGVFEVKADASFSISFFGSNVGLGVVNDANAAQRGRIVVDASASLSIDTNQTLVNNGVLDANGGAITIADAISGSGSAIVSNDGTLSFGSTFDQNVTFEGANAGTLVLSGADSGLISGFGQGDTIVLGAVNYAADDRMVWLSTSAGVQTFAVEDSADDVLATLQFAGHYSGNDFSVAESGSGSAQVTLGQGPATKIDASDFNGDGTSDILFRDAADGETYLWSMNGPNVTSGAPTSTQVGDSWRIAGVGDFNGDGVSDLLWTYDDAGNAADPLNGVSYVSMQNGPSATAASGVVEQLSTHWQVAGVGDFTGSGVSDILYRYANASDPSDPLDGRTYIDMMNGSQVNWAASGFTSQQVTDPNWQVAAVADFSGVGQADILWRYDDAANAANPLNGTLYEWAMNGTSVTSAGLLSQQPGSANWQVEGTGDFNGDGDADILFRYENAANAADPLNGLTYIDFMNGATVTSGAPTSWQIDNSWQVAGVGDYNGDGKSDILWSQTSTGSTYIWEMDGAHVASGAFTSQQTGLGWTTQNGKLIG